MNTTALVLDNVVKTYGDVNAVDGLSFRVNRGEILCLLGPNGAGKTTTIEMCEGFTKPTSGNIDVLGLDPSRHPDAVRARIGIMLQGGGSYSGIKVREMLKLSASYNANPLGSGLVARDPRAHRRGKEHIPSPIRWTAATPLSGAGDNRAPRTRLPR